MIQYQGFIWIGLFVEDLPAAVAFYRDVLGLGLLDKGDDWAHFDAGDEALFELFGGGKAARAPKDPAQQPLVVGLRVKDMDHAMAELQAKGILFTETGGSENTRWAHFSDPEGNQLEIKAVPETEGQ
jgi:predicted enzyme related to lactoylglutathione lyase